MGNPSQKHVELRHRIMASATRSFGRDGFQGASMRRIAKELGITAPNLYYYFRSKQDLVWAILSQGLERFCAVSEGALEAHSQPPDQIREHVIAHVRFTYEHVDLVQMMDLFFTSVSQAPGDIHSGVETMARNVLSPENAQRFSSEVSGLLQRIARTIDAGARNGQFAIDSLELATGGVIILPDRVMRWVKPGPVMSVDTIARQTARMVLRMLGQAEPRPRTR